MIELHEETTSTNDLALEAAERGAPHGACWLADHQTEGRGRREVGGERREWFSPAGCNIYMSTLLKPDLSPDRATSMTLAAAVGVADAITEETALDLWIKWPNDLYVGECKLGGILTEASAEAGGIEAIVVGLGVNVNVNAGQVPDELSDVLTSLQIETNRQWDRLSLALRIQREWLERCDAFAEEGLEAVIDALQAYDRSAGCEVAVRRKGDVVEGTAQGIGDDGRLLVDLDGETVRVRAGEVSFRSLGE